MLIKDKDPNRMPKLLNEDHKKIRREMNDLNNKLSRNGGVDIYWAFTAFTEC